MFTDADWNTAQPVTLSGVADDLVDGTKQVMVTYDVSSLDAGYGPLLNVTQSLDVTDADVAGVVLDPDPLPDINEGVAATVTVRLAAAAETGVALAFTSPFPAVATLSSTPILATLTTLDDRATVTLETVNDDVDGINRTYALKVSVVSGPGGYAGLELTVSGTVLDDDVTNLVLDPASLTDLAEGATSTVSVRLGSQPTADVTVAVTGSDATELSFSPTSLEFTATDWNTAKFVTLSGLADNVVDGNQTVTVTYGLSSGDTDYGGLPDVTQTLTVTDIQVAGLESDPTQLAPINEAGDGSTATVTVRLSTAAEGGVALSFTSSAPAVATLTADSVTATLTTTTDEAIVTLGAVSDNAVTGIRGYALQVSVVSGPGGYAGLDLSVTGMVLDDDTANLVLDPPSLPDVAEDATSTVSVSLATQPTAIVTVAVSSSDPDELSASIAELVFTDADWNTEQPVTLSGVRDNLVDGNQAVTVTYDLSSSGTDYENSPDVTQSLEVTDVDVAGLATDLTTLPTINENGGTATVILRLLAAAETGVELSFTSPFAAATLSSTPLLATLTTLDDRATVTLGAVNDDTDAFLNRAYDLRVRVLSGPGAYLGLMLTIRGEVMDDDVAGLVLDPPSLPGLAEGATSTVSVSLATRPGSEVTVAVASDVPTEATVTPAELVFTPDDWNTAQPVTLSGVADDLVDGNQTVTVTYNSSSSNALYGVLAQPVTQSQLVTDSDVAFFVSDPTPLPTINEAGGMATVILSLSIAAETDVALVITSPFPAVATLTSPLPLSVTLRTLGDSATVTLGAVADMAQTGDRTYALKMSVVFGPGGFDGLEQTVTGIVRDDDTAGLVLDPASLTDLAEGATATVSVMLATQPSADVTVAVTGSDATELSFSPTSLEFTATDWNTAKPVTLSGLTDSVVDGNQAVTVTYDLSSNDSDYGGLSDVTQTLTVTDVQVAGLESDPTQLSPINEAGGMATVTVRLSTAAEGGVALSFTSSAPAVATLTATAVTVTLTTTTDEAIVTLGAVSDNAVTGNRGYALQVSVVSGPGGYGGLELTVSGSVTDDDVANLVLDPPSLPNVAEGATSTVSVKLATQPSADVTVAIASSDRSELTASIDELEFTDTDWNTAKPVTLSGFADSVVDGNQAVTVTYGLSSNDSDYGGLSDVTQTLTVTDVQVAGFGVTPGSLTLAPINEAGGMATVTVRLSTAAEGVVALSFTSSAPAVATLTATAVTVTLTTTTDEAIVTLGAVSDNAVTGNRGYALQVSVVSGPGGYGGLELTVTGTVLDDDSANLVLDPPSLPNVAEGATSTVSVKLATQPSADVTVAIASSDRSELTASIDELEFTSTDWNTAKPVTLSGFADSVVDGNQAVTVTYGLSSNDSDYGGLSDVTQMLTVTDVQVAGFGVTPGSLTLSPINEAGGMATVTVRLSTAAEGVVALSFTSSAPAVATLTATAVTVTLTTTTDEAIVTLGAVSDNAVTGNRGYALQVSVVSGPGGYGGLELTVSGSVTDDDVANLVLDPPSLPNVAEGATYTVSVKLATQPSADVTVAIASSDRSELTASIDELEFTSTDWNTAKPVTLSGLTDSVVDGNQAVTVTYGLSSNDSDYGGLSDVTQTLTVTDVQVAGFGVTPGSLTLAPINEAGGMATVTVRLSTAAEGVVALSFTSSAPAVATLTATAVTVTLTTTTDEAIVTLGAVSDNAVTGNRGYALQVSVVSGPGGYGGLELTVSGSVTDDDVANLVLDPPSLPNVAEGATSTVSVKLATQPSADVTVAIASSDRSELTASIDELEFTDTDWNTAKPVTLSGLADSVVDGNQAVTVTYGLSSNDTVYGPLSDVTQTLTVTDVQVAGFGVTPGSLTLASINEAGGMATVTVRLSTAAEGVVALSFTSSAPAVATLTATAVTVTLTTTTDEAIVTLGAVSDNAVTGNRGYALQVSVVSGPGGYGGLELTVSGSVTDDDVANLVLDPPSLPNVAEGATYTVSVKLATQPSADVTVAIASSDRSELTASIDELEFTDTDWNTAKPVTLSGFADSVVDGNQAVTVTYGLSSNDSDYGGLSDVTQTLTVTDVQVAGFGVTPGSLTLAPINEAGGMATVTVRLSTAAEGVVALSFTSSAPAVATLTATAVTVTLTTTTDEAIVTLGAVSDNAVTGNRGYALQVSVVSGPGGYGGLELTVTGTVLDDDSANLVLDPASLTDLAEGATATVSVKLATQPSADVTVAIASSDRSELTASIDELEFTSTDWNTAKPVTLSGFADSVVDGNQAVTVTYGLSSNDSDYGGLSDVTQSLTVTDVQVAGFGVTPGSLTLAPINEAGGMATVTVRLSTAAEGVVALSFTSSAPAVATLTATAVTVTLTTTTDEAIVTLGAVSDNAVTGNRGYALKVSVVSGPGGYAGLELSVTGMVLDDDSANLVLDPPSLPNVAEGATSTVSVKLATQPSADVTVAIASSDRSELTASIDELEFTSTDWNTAKPVTLSGFADSVVDGNQAVTVTYGLSSNDSDYGGLSDVTQTLTVTDVQVAGFGVTPGSLTLSPINEAGGMATVTVRLSTAAEGVVALSFTSSAPAVATLTATAVTVTLTTTTDEAIVTLGAVSDNAVTGNRGYALQVSVVSGPGGYGGLELTVSGSVTDDDVANLVLAPASLTDLAEGATSTVSVKLATQPSADVTVAIASSDRSELTASIDELEFTSTDWNTAKPVTLSGLTDSVVDGNQAVTVTYGLSSNDSDYGGLSDVTQTLTVTDVQVAGFGVTPGSLTLAPINEAGDGSTATVTVRLSTAAEGVVALSFTSSAPAVATLTATAVTVTLTTTTDKAIVTLGAVSDNAVTGNRGYALQVSVVSGPGGYAGLELTVTGTVLDDDSANLVLDPPSLPNVAEGATYTVSVKLATQPSADVTVAIASSDRSELTASIDELEFTATDWNTAKPVTLSGFADSVVDGNQAVTVTYGLSSNDSDYGGLSDVTQTLTVTDVQVAGFGVTPGSLTLAPINEAGGMATVTVRLSTAAEGVVALSFTSSAPAVATLTATAVTVTLTTTTDEAIVTLGAVSDNAVTGNRGYALKVSVVSGPGGYGGLELTVSGSVTDDDVANLVLDPASLTALAEGATSTVSVKLATQPSADVTVAIASSDRSELTASIDELEFTATDWNTAKPVTLSGFADSVVDGNQAVTVTYGLSSNDSDYGGLSDVTQMLTVTDVQVAGFGVTPGSLTLSPINEAGGMATVTVRLSTAAEGVVALSFTSSAPAVATLTATAVTVTLTTTTDEAIVTLGAVSDNAVTGNRGYALQVSVVSGPGGYAGLELTVTGTVLDDDSPNLVLAPASLTDLAEGATSTVSVMLATQPASRVTVAVSSSNPGELSVSPAQLVFLPGNWNTSRPVTLSGVRDNLVDGPKPVAITYNLSSSDAGYGGLPDVTQSLDVTDADVAGIELDPDPLPDINEGVAATVTVRLSTAAEGGVALSFTSPFPAVATLSSTPILATLTTLGDEATVTLETVGDDVDGINRIYALKVSVVSGPGAYAGLELTATGTVLDDDVSDLELTPTTLPVLAESAASMVAVRLGSQPTANVTVAIASSDRGELLVSPSTLEFTDTDWNINQPVKLSGVRDNEVDGTQAVAVTYTASSSDNKYNSLAATTQSQDVTDSDMAGLALEPAATTLPPLSEPDGAATVSLRLLNPSSSPVTLAVWSSDRTVATLTSMTVTLTLMSELDRGAVALGVVDNTAPGDRGYDLRVSVVRGVNGYTGLDADCHRHCVG